MIFPWKVNHIHDYMISTSFYSEVKWGQMKLLLNWTLNLQDSEIVYAHSPPQPPHQGREIRARLLEVTMP